MFSASQSTLTGYSLNDILANNSNSVITQKSECQGKIIAILDRPV